MRIQFFHVRKWLKNSPISYPYIFEKGPLKAKSWSVNHTFFGDFIRFLGFEKVVRQGE